MKFEPSNMCVFMHTCTHTHAHIQLSSNPQLHHGSATP
jgi:hypothetical protein